MRIITCITFPVLIFLSAITQQSMQAMEGAVVALQLNADDEKVWQLIKQLIEVSQSSKPHQRGKEDKIEEKYLELSDALITLDVSAIEHALTKQFIAAMMVRLSGGESEIEFSDLIERGRAILRKEQYIADTLFGAFLAKILPEVLVEAIFGLCSTEGYTKMIIACELSDSVQMQNWIQNHLKTADGIKEVEVEVGGTTPLISAATHGATSSAQGLIDAGATVNQSNIFGETPLIAAAVADRPEMMQLLLTNKAFKDWRNDSGYTALHCATRYDRKKALAWLIEEAKADINLPNKIGESPLTTAISCNNPYLVSLLLKNGSYYNRDEKNSELHCSIKELAILYTWSNRDLISEANAKDVITQLVFDKRTVINSELIEALERIDMTEVTAKIKNL